MKKIALIGAGGLSTHIVAALAGAYNLVIIDGDKYEEKNIQRQNFAEGNIGKNKADVLKTRLSTWSKHKVESIPLYLTQASSGLHDVDIIVAAVDNNDARLTAQYWADKLYVPLIMGVNEEYDPQAYLYLPGYKGTKADPFIFAGITPDGRDPSKSCTGEMTDDDKNVQTALANTVAGGFVLHILHSLEAAPESIYATAKVIANNNSIHSRTVDQLIKEDA